MIAFDKCSCSWKDKKQKKKKKKKKKVADNQFDKMLRVFDLLPIFLFTTS